MSKFILTAFADEINKDLKTQMDVLENHNIKYIDLREINRKCIVDYTLDEVAEIKKQLDERGFKISAIASPIGKIYITDDFEPHLELFKHTLDIADILEVKYIRMFSFFIPHGEEPVKYRQEVLNRWNEFISAAKGRDVILLHENEKEIYGDTPERCLDLIETLNCKYMKVLIDPANFVQCNVETFPYAYNMLKDYIEYLHIKDALFTSGKVVPSGCGDGKIKEILCDLHERGFEGFISLEPHLGYFEDLDRLYEGDIEEVQFERNCLEYFETAAHALKKVINVVVGGK